MAKILAIFLLLSIVATTMVSAKNLIEQNEIIEANDFDDTDDESGQENDSGDKNVQWQIRHEPFDDFDEYLAKREGVHVEELIDLGNVNGTISYTLGARLPGQLTFAHIHCIWCHWGYVATHTRRHTLLVLCLVILVSCLLFVFKI